MKFWFTANPGKKRKSETQVARMVPMNFQEGMFQRPVAPVTHQIVEKPLPVVPKEVIEKPEFIHGATMLEGGEQSLQVRRLNSLTFFHYQQNSNFS
jgi:hypothetical protein